MRIVEEGNLEIGYIEMLNTLENNSEIKDLPDDNELRQLSGCRDQISIVTLGTGIRLIVKKEAEILIQKTMREDMMRILHFTHIGDAAILRQTKGKIFWPNMRGYMKSAEFGPQIEQTKRKHIVR